jgi:acetyl-CoA synthetase
MKYECIKKNAKAFEVTPNFQDYNAIGRGFSWAAVRPRLAGLPGGGLNIAHESVDRHVTVGHGERLAIRWLTKSGEKRDCTYAELSRLTSRFANVLATLGIGRSERTFSLLGRVPEIYIGALGTSKAGAVFSPAVLGFRP